MIIPAKPTEKEPPSMLEGMGKETDEITTIRAGLALLHSILTTDGSYTISCMTVWDNARKALNNTATALTAKDAEIERLKEAMRAIIDGGPIERIVKIARAALAAKEDDDFDAMEHDRHVTEPKLK